MIYKDFESILVLENKESKNLKSLTRTNIKNMLLVVAVINSNVDD